MISSPEETLTHSIIWIKSSHWNFASALNNLTAFNWTKKPVNEQLNNNELKFSQCIICFLLKKLPR